MEYLLETARASETEDVFALYADRIQWMNENGIRQWNMTDYLQAYPKSYYQRQQREGRLYVLKQNGRIAGAAVLLEQDERWPDSGITSAFYVHNLVTRSDAKGVGVLLLAQAEALAKARGKRKMRLDCAVDNPFLNQYYENLGYRPAGCCTDGPYEGNLREKTL